MKHLGNCLVVLMAVVVAWAALPCQGQVTLGINPPVIGNNYPGAVTLQIGGLPSGDQVQITRYLDLNGAGVLQAGDPVMDAFKITDNGAFVVGGITNNNVPFDSNSATGAITTALNLTPPRVVGNLVGNYIFKLSSPSKDFAPVTAAFAITNASTGQSVSGIVYSNGLTPLPHGLVVALVRAGSEDVYAGATEADANGNYLLNLNPGSYVILPLTPGYFTDTSIAPQGTLTNGMTAISNLSLTNGPAAISGNVSDTSGNLLGGVLLELKSGNLMAIAITDSNGNYSASVAPAVWKVKVDDGHLAERAYVSPQNSLSVDTTGGSVTGQNITVYKASALLYGRIADTNGVPFTNLSVSAQDDFGLYTATGISDASGNYCIAIQGGTNYWNWGPDNSALPPSSYLISGGNTAFPATGQAIQQNFTVIPASAEISGHLQDNLGNSLVGVGINASGTVYGTNYNTQVDTDSSGNYSLGVVPGTWTVGVNCCGNDGLASQYDLTSTNYPVVTIPPTNVVVNFTAVPPVPLSLRGMVLPNATVNQGYNFSFNPAGGEPPYSYSVISNSLPPGLFLSSGGYLSGMPTNSGTFAFTLQVADQTPTNVTASFTIHVIGLLQIVTSNLPNAVVGAGYFNQLQSVGGLPPYSWGLASGPLPSGLEMSTNGLLFGTPLSGTAGTYSLDVTLSDSSSQSSTQWLMLVVTTTNVAVAGPYLSSPGQNADGSFQFGFYSAADTPYTIECSSNLITWFSLLSFQSSGGPMLIVDPNAAGSLRRFYRLKAGR